MSNEECTVAPHVAVETALKYAVRLGNQGHLLESHIFSCIALQAMQSQNSRALRNKINISCSDEICQHILPLWERAESGHQKEEAAHQAKFIYDVCGTWLLSSLQLDATETFRRLFVLLEGGRGMHAKLTA